MYQDGIKICDDCDKKRTECICEKNMKPMLAAEAPKKLNFPLMCSTKIDGIRAVIMDGCVLSRSLKVIPNRFVQDQLGFHALNGLDGELTVGEPHHPNVMQRTTSGVMSRDGEPDFTFWVFDYYTNLEAPYHKRYLDLTYGMTKDFQERHPRVKLLQHGLIRIQEQLDETEAAALAQGYEGLMLRDPNGLYKFGRSTAREGGLLKLKRFKDSEAVVIGFEERMHNANEATVNKLGHTERSSHKENMIPMGMLGALLVRNAEGIEFGIGTGFTDERRRYFWDNRQGLLGLTVKYKHFETGVKVAPRFPVFIGFRDPIDL